MDASKERANTTESQLDDDNNDRDQNGKPLTITLFGKEMSRDMGYYIVDGICLILLIVSFVIVGAVVEWTAFVWRFYVGFGCFMAFCIVVAEVNHWNKFQSMTAYFNRWRYPLIVIFFVLAIGDFILLELSDVPDDCDFDDPALKDNCPILNPDENGVRYMTRFFTIVCGALFLCCIMGYWERVSFLSAHNSWVIAILYMTVVGAIFLYFSRCLEPPPRTPQQQKENWSWHQPRSTNKILTIIIKFMIVVVLFFVIMGSIVLALFGDASRSSETLGTWAAMIIFIFIAHIIMITPLAPGSVVDVCAGFLFVSLFVNNEGASIEAAFFVSLAITIALHFSGSCAQYYVGKIGAVQIWANKTLPPEMLAASDSVLKTANWFKVGVVGQVFMDTANGLNQGRMDMPWCTQFWSEYASIPNAIGLVSLGTILAIPSFDRQSANVDSYDWAEDAIPLVFMITSLWQMIASSWGAKELLASSGTVSFWTALEKWSTVQYFYQKGYVPTHTGWDKDVYQLGTVRKDNDNYNDEQKENQSLYDMIQEYRQTNLDKNHVASTSMNYKADERNCGQFFKALCSTPKQPDAQRNIIRSQKKLTERSLELRQNHWDRIEKNLDELVKKGELARVPPEVCIQNYFDNAEGWMLVIHILITLGVFFTGIGCYFLIASNVSLSDAVSEGVGVLGTDNVSIGGWICLILFWSLIIIYFHKEVKYNMQELISNLSFICKGCKSEEDAKDIETVFNTPGWANAPKEFQDFIEKTKSQMNIKEEIIIDVNDNKYKQNES